MAGAAAGAATPAPALAGAAQRADVTAEAFDRVAATYDGPQGNNDLIQRMRDITWARMGHLFPPGGRVIDLGCGTGIDAAHLAAEGFTVVGTDWSAEMVARCAARADHVVTGTDAAESPSTADSPRLTARRVGAHDLSVLVDEGQRFDAAMSNFGPLNCVDDLSITSRQLAAILTPGAPCLFTVIGRVCPWEVVHYLLRGRWKRATVRFRRQQTPVGMAGGTIWTRYYTPREFARRFSAEFEVVRVEALSLFVPPPYLTWMAERAPRLFRAACWLDERVGGWPVLRSMGDHFMIELRRR